MRAVKRVLAIGAHPDDIELGCGGTLAKLIKEDGVEVRALVMSQGETGIGKLLVDFDRQQETLDALKLLGIQDSYVGNFPDAYLHMHLNKMISTIEYHVKEFAPDRVYTMFQHDRHQDHRAVFDASIVACRSVPQVLCYETPSSWPNFVPCMFEQIDEYFDLKAQALHLHMSQSDRDYTQPDNLRISAAFRGQQTGNSLNEGFIPYKFVF